MAEIKMRDNIREIVNAYPVPLSRIMDDAVRIQEAASDVGVENPYGLGFRVHKGRPVLDYRGHSYTMSDWALAQYCGKLNVPAAYIRNCIRTGHAGIAEDNIRYWQGLYGTRKGSDMLLRTCNGNVRGVVSEKFALIDAPDILDVVSSTIDSDSFTVRGSFISEERMHLRMVANKPLAVKGERDLYPMVYVDSSDVGRCTVCITFGIYKKVCTNGLVILSGGGTIFRQRHIGLGKDEFRRGLVAGLQGVPYLIENAERLVGRSISKPLETRDMDGFAEKLHKRFALDGEAAERVMALMGYRYGFTRWGLINGITEEAQNYTLERRIEIERLAGGMLFAA